MPEHEKRLHSFEEYMGLPSGEIALEMRNTFITHVQTNNECRQIKANTYFTHSSFARSFYRCIRNKRFCSTEQTLTIGQKRPELSNPAGLFYYSKIDKTLPFRFLHFYCLVHKLLIKSSWKLKGDFYLQRHGWHSSVSAIKTLNVHSYRSFTNFSHFDCWRFAFIWIKSFCNCF